jgi:hypothetical protein
MVQFQFVSISAFQLFAFERTAMENFKASALGEGMNCSQCSTLNLFLVRHDGSWKIMHENPLAVEWK